MEKRVSKNSIKRNILRVGTGNVRSLIRQVGKLENLKVEMSRSGLDITGEPISEIRWPKGRDFWRKDCIVLSMRNRKQVTQE